MNDNKIKFAEATEANAISIANLSRELGYETDPEKVAINLNAIKDSKECKVWVALTDNEVVGWCHAAKTHWVMMESMVEVFGLVVSSKIRNNGVGKILIAKVEEWTREQGVDEVWIRSNIKRMESHPFYLAIGYKNIKDQSVYVKDVNFQKA